MDECKTSQAFDEPVSKQKQASSQPKTMGNYHYVHI